MNNLVIYGAGGLGREIALMVNQLNAYSLQWNLLGFFDDHKKKGERVDGLPVLGGMKELNEHENTGVALAIADPVVRKKLRGEITSNRISFPVLIHPSVNTGDRQRNTFEEGTLITAGNFITTNVHIGAFTIINLASTIGHDVKIGAFTSVMPSCSLSGFIDIGEQVLIGSGVRILPGLTIGSRSRIGAGAVVTRPVPEGVTVAGIPARILEP